MRRQLIEAVGRKLDLLLTSQTPDTLSTYAKQIAELREQAAQSREQLLEQVAYSWFNRLAALRYLDAKGWHPFGCRVLMPAGGGETQPELLKLMRSGSLPLELKEHTNETRLNGLLDGQIPTAIAGADPQGEVYRELVLAVCHSYHQLLPNLFEGLDDASELLLPDDLLSDGSIAGGFRSQISDTDCQDVEILGWLYQFYISEKKDEVMARKKPVPSEDIPAVTQLFTPHWIVRYLVENSLGRLWLLNRPESKLRDQMPYYIEGETETDFLQISKPEDIKLLDPACGSGHMLTYAFDLLSHIYTEEGYAAAEIPGLILQHNLYGLDICPRATQLAGLALVLKAREQSRRFFQPGQLVQPQIIELQDVRFDEGELNDYIEALNLGELFDSNLFKLLHQFEEAKNFGSLIQPCLDERAIANVRRAIEAKDLGGQLFLRETHLKVLRVLEHAEALTQRYHVVVANPPYMGSGSFSTSLKQFSSKEFKNSKSDLGTMFIERAAKLVQLSGAIGLITMQSWMFLGSFAKLRHALLNRFYFSSLLMLGARAFDSIGGEVVQTVAFSVFNRSIPSKLSICFDLTDFHGEAAKESAFFELLREPTQRGSFVSALSSLLKLPGHPLAFWLSERSKKSFELHPGIAEVASVEVGLQTSDNARFLRYWHEVSSAKLMLLCSDDLQARSCAKKWFPLEKGGSSRKWAGNAEYVVNWEQGGKEIKDFVAGRYAYLGGNPDYVVKDRGHFFKPGVSWNKINSGLFSTRDNGPGFIFSDAGMKVIAEDSILRSNLLGLLNSVVATNFLQAFSQTLNCEKGNIERVPFAKVPGAYQHVTQCVKLARTDWDNFETSWGFTELPFLQPGLKGQALEASWQKWEMQCSDAIHQMQKLETENNRLFIAAYGLEGELEPEVPEEQITLARADARKDMAAFLSYAVGCMMGRYSPDHPGLILANAGDSAADFRLKLANAGLQIHALSFQPDEDGIVPVLDGEWFEDDIVARTRDFLRATFGEATLRENLRFIEDALGKDLRKYFLTDFYKDHLQTYKKRPIYWLVQSPKKGFSVLLYLHRYTRDTMNGVLNRYLRDYQVKLRNRITHLAEQEATAASAKAKTEARKEGDKLKKTLHECEEWERQTLLPLAQARIELDLDDGVKVNYLKLGEALAPIPGLAAKED